ncbi:hypothetical protein ACWDG1_39775 [Streptomyces sp. NPDC001177]
MSEPGRYHLTVTAGGRTVMHGWWGARAAAERMFALWVGSCSWGTLPEVAVMLRERAEVGEPVRAD